MLVSSVTGVCCPAFLDHIVASPSQVNSPIKMRPLHDLETVDNRNPVKKRNIPEEQRSHLLLPIQLHSIVKFKKKTHTQRSTPVKRHQWIKLQNINCSWHWLLSYCFLARNATDTHWTDHMASQPWKPQHECVLVTLCKPPRVIAFAALASVQFRSPFFWNTARHHLVIAMDIPRPPQSQNVRHQSPMAQYDIPDEWRP
jgi:hypothetical protein